MLDKGDTAPDFELPDQAGELIKLATLLDSGPVVLYFYPADFTAVCTREACAFRDRHEDLSNLDVRIVGISPQNQASHRRFAETYGLPFPLLCDTSKKVIRAYGVDGPLGLGVRRVTYLIGRDRIIANRAVSDIFLGSHLALIEEVLGQE